MIRLLVLLTIGILLLGCTGRAFDVGIPQDLDNGNERAGIQSQPGDPPIGVDPAGIFESNFTVDEGEYLTFQNRFNQSENPNCPCNLTIIPNQSAIYPWGAIMPTNTTFNGWGYGEHEGYPPAIVTSQFRWTPSICQGTKIYIFNVSQYKQQIGQDSAGLCNIFVYRITVRDKNRPPVITTTAASRISVKLGDSLALQFRKSDPDRDECRDDFVAWGESIQFTGPKVTQPGYTYGGPYMDLAYWNWGPVKEGDLGSHTLSLWADDGKGGQANKIITIIAYKPTASTCGGKFQKPCA